MFNKLVKLIVGKSSGESGAALILALLIVAIGCLILGPLLSFIGSSYKTTDRVYDQ